MKVSTNRHLQLPTRRRQLRLRTAALLLGVAAMLATSVAARAPQRQAAARRSAPALTDLKDPSQLRDLFNQDRGVTRLVLLLSPT